jgi:uncharacterized membrane protein YbhN (UPF0104 family)
MRHHGKRPISILNSTAFLIAGLVLSIDVHFYIFIDTVHNHDNSSNCFFINLHSFFFLLSWIIILCYDNTRKY